MPQEVDNNIETRRGSSGWWALFTNALVLFTVIISFFIIAEIVVRNSSTPSLQAFWNYRTFKFDPVVGWSRIPNSQFVFVHDNVAQSVHVVNQMGFVDSDHVIPKPNNVFRIIFLGDSYTEAIQVESSKRFSTLLEQRLNSLGLGKKIEVVNLGVTGYSTDQEYLTLKNYGLSLQPDLVILNFFSYNDVRDNSIALRKTGPSKPFYKIADDHLLLASGPQAPSLLARLMYKSAFATYVNVKWIMLMDRLTNTAFDKKSVYAPSYSDDWDEAWEITKKLISSINEDVLSHGAKFLLVSIPSPVEVIPTLSDEFTSTYGVVDFRKPSTILKSFAGDRGIPFLDTHEFFSNRSDVEDLFLALDTHLTDAGNDALATDIFDFLVDSQLVR